MADTDWFRATIFDGMYTPDIAEVEEIYFCQPGAGAPLIPVEAQMGPGNGTCIYVTAYDMVAMICLCKWIGPTPGGWVVIEAAGLDGLDNVRSEFTTIVGRAPTDGEVF